MLMWWKLDQISNFDNWIDWDGCDSWKYYNYYFLECG
jgi:hypothetical protein